MKALLPVLNLFHSRSENTMLKGTFPPWLVAFYDKQSLHLYFHVQVCMACSGSMCVALSPE